MKKKRIAILGSTGSIGVNALKVIAAHPDRFEVVLLAAHNSVNLIRSQIRQYAPKFVAMASVHLPQLKKDHSRVKFFDAQRDLPELVSRADIDVVVIAMTGAAALEPFLAAVRAGKKVAPANKEALVMAGDILMEAARRSGSVIVPVDSEQSAIFQCLEGRNTQDLHQIHLTASGGALRCLPRMKHDQVSVKDILAHPRWKMGAKITVDSATLMNKGFEVIEAQRLFGVGVDKINVLIHPEAIIHSMVEFIDGSIIAQLGVTDMRLPIQYALTYPERLPMPLKRLDLVQLKALTFEAPDLKKFPSLKLAYAAARQAGTAPTVLNAADEIAVEAFLKGKIKFTGIHSVVERTLSKHVNVPRPGLLDIKYADGWARQKAQEIVERVS
ncbi:MAG: 1-deoxy-D-xylulose-5-phosphate reductoisomerase [Candidatus Omnitrophica bacterium]|nr:1-deoxy-D-xylulose-5-phosphate reductoisomerase [Candidatus Omnitrophota bacterium]